MRKLDAFSSDEVFFELLSTTMEEEKGERRAENGNFLANKKSSNEFSIRTATVGIIAMLVSCFSLYLFRNRQRMPFQSGVASLVVLCF